MSLTATHAPVFIMKDGHSCRGRTERLLPRASIYDCSVYGMEKAIGGRMTSALVYLVFTSAPSSVWMLWSSPILFTPSVYRDVLVQLCIPHFTRGLGGGPAFPLYLSPTTSRQSTLNPQLPCSFSMARKRGTPRRGAAWEAQKAQRRRKDQLEKALALATSILRQRARAERMARLATIAEPGVGSSRDVKGKAPGALQNSGSEEEFPPCIIVEDPSLKDLSMDDPSICEKTRVATHPEACKLTTTLLDDTPGCIVEEIPWPGDETCSCLGAQAFDEGSKGATAAVEQMAFEGGSEVTMDGGGSLHGSLIRDEHLALLFDLRGHLSDLEHRALLMGQRMDMLFDAFSNAPAKRKCPLCAQAFAILAGTTRQNSEDDRSPGI
jgi:hypothetical protein